MAAMKVVTTSWDDGHILDTRLADLLRNYSIPGTFYISPKNRQWRGKELLSRKQVIQLSKEYEIGAHTLTHPELTNVSLHEAKAEVLESKEYLEALLGKVVNMFCYPRGLFNDEVKKLVKEAGFTGARTIQTYRTKPPADFYEMGTTNHTVDRDVMYSYLLALKNNPGFIPFLHKGSWLQHSKKMFDYISDNDGIWHFWGHSWQIEQMDCWGQLEELFSYVSNNKSFYYLSNGEIVKQLKRSK